MKNRVQLITYPDSLGGNLKGLSHVLKNYFSGIFQGGIHILPPFPSSGDRGFAPVTYLEIDSAFGTWEDIRELGREYDIILDLMVNHISRQSLYFQDFLKKGMNSEFSDLFITPGKIWKDREPAREELEGIFLRRLSPFSSFQIEDTGETVKVWTTFGKQDPSEQIDMDIHSGVFWDLLQKYFKKFGENNVRMVRLDAVGYVIKKPGTSCFFVEPEIYHFLEKIKRIAEQYRIELLPEVHAEYQIQFGLAGHGCWIYDFILPYLVLDALMRKSSADLKKYLLVRPHRQFTMLDCHDGIPVKPDLNGLYQSGQARNLVNECMVRGGNLSRVFSPKHKDADGFDVHQIRCTYYSALNCNDDAYLAARALQFFTPGIPQVYYVGLLAGENDYEAVSRNGEGREINRHNFTEDEIRSALRKETVRRLIKLIRFRNDYPAFEGGFSIPESGGETIILKWEKGDRQCALNVDFMTGSAYISFSDDDGVIVRYDI